MELAHETMMSGHMGKKKTTDITLSNFFWPGMKDDVRKFCLSCDICQRTHNKGCMPKVPIQKMPLIDTPFKRVAVDIVGPIQPPSTEGHRFILTLVDYATRYPEAAALKGITTEEIAKSLLMFYICLGVPEEILSDMGSQFMSDCIKEVERLLKMRHMSTTPYRPQCNGLVEKFNETLKTTQGKLCVDQSHDWHRYLDALLFAYPEVPQATTRFVPFSLLYGRSVRGPMHIFKEMWSAPDAESEVLSSYRYAFELCDKMEKVWTIIEERVGASQNKYKDDYDQMHRVKQRQFQCGDFILLLLPTQNNKLLMQWKGPCEVVEKVEPADYKVDMNGKMKIFHANLLKKYDVREDTANNDTIASFAKQSTTTEEAESELDTQWLEFVEMERKETLNEVKIENLLVAEKLQATKLLNDFSDIFSKVRGCMNLQEHKITLTCDKPVRSKPDAVPFSMCEALNHDLDAMLENKIIRPSDSPYASPAVLVPEKDGSTRLCVDYQKLNKITVFDLEPMVNSADIFQKLANDRYFTTIDLTKGYQQIPVVESDIYKTAFVTHAGT